VAEHLCPVWVGYFLANRLRMLWQNPYKLVAPYLKTNMKVLDVGSAMGFFSLPMAQMVGPAGKVVCVDVQPKMLEVLRRRATRAGLAERIETHVSREDSPGLDGRSKSFDFALAFAVLHEVPDQARFLREIRQLLKPGAHLLLAEPAGHVTVTEFEQTVKLASEAGLAEMGRPEIRLSHAALFARSGKESGS
jgi:2-polyprenyl-3-methyl-5-hydroxy-6-metoxy-1,4-benzoquinol methylase